MILSLWIFLGGSIGQVYAQDEFNPTPPPEPGKLTLLLSTDPHGSAYLEQTNPSGIYDTGTEVTVRAYPHTDYEFVAWQSADGEELSGLSEYTFTFTEKNACLIAKLRFNPKENPSEPGDGYYNLITTVAPSMAGWVEQSGQGIYENGKEVTLIAHAYPGRAMGRMYRKRQPIASPCRASMCTCGPCTTGSRKVLSSRRSGIAFT